MLPDVVCCELPETTEEGEQFNSNPFCELSYVRSCMMGLSIFALFLGEGEPNWRKHRDVVGRLKLMLPT